MDAEKEACGFRRTRAKRGASPPLAKVGRNPHKEPKWAENAVEVTVGEHAAERLGNSTNQGASHRRPGKGTANPKGPEGMRNGK